MAKRNLVTKRQRDQVEAIITNLIDLLDTLDDDPDLERDCDLEEGDALDHGEHDPAEWGVADAGALDLVHQDIALQRAWERCRDERKRAKIEIHKAMLAKGLKPKPLPWYVCASAPR